MTSTSTAAMPPRIPRASIGLPRLSKSSAESKSSGVCFFCSQSPIFRRSRASSKPYRRIDSSRTRSASTLSPHKVEPPQQTHTLPRPREELQDAIKNLRKVGRRFVNLSRLELALHGLHQAPGQEAIRIAILGLADGGNSLKSAREILRLILADPLKTEEEWESRVLNARRNEKPLLLRVGQNEVEESTTGGWLVQELRVSSPALNGHNLELLVLEMEPRAAKADEAFAENILVPTMEIPTSNTGRYTPITTPVHKALIVGEGLNGAASLIGYPALVDPALIELAANVRMADQEPTPIKIVNFAQAKDALQLFRQSVGNALVYEQQWFQSGLPELVEWIKVGTSSTTAEMKEPLRKLIESLLARANSAAQEQEASQLATILSSHVSAEELLSLQKAFSWWSEGAHTELRDQLDEAFDSHRWRKLSWWKLFWRVDDVSMIASDILSKQFLTMADKEVVFLAGAISQTGIIRQSSFESPHDAELAVDTPSEHTTGSHPPPPNIYKLLEPRDRAELSRHVKRWPTHIELTRNYLLSDTVPALQALAQRLVLQTLSTSSVWTAAAGLMYVSTISTSLYEAGAVAALGVVWSLRRMQKKWETARQFWEGEVREEGRKAVKGVEVTVREVLKDKSKAAVPVDEELELVREAVRQAEEALERCR